MLTSAILFIHLLSFAAYVGAGFTQLQFMNMSRKAGLAPELRDAYERISATIITKIELPAILGSMGTGAVFISQNAALMKMGWIHGKLTCVLLLAVLSHLEMFNARGIVTARAAGGAGVEDVITAKKSRHAIYGKIGGLLVLAILVLVTFVRLG